MIAKLTFADANAVPARIRAVLPSMVTALTDRVTWWMLALQQKIQRDYLSGQVLQHRTGKLIGSIHAIPTELQGSQIIGIVEGAGGPAYYGQYWERGIMRGGAGRQALDAMAGGSARAALQSLARPTTLDQRAFMAPALQDIRNAMVADLQRTAGASIQ
jgi:hypothetical protein